MLMKTQWKRNMIMLTYMSVVCLVCSLSECDCVTVCVECVLVAFYLKVKVHDLGMSMTQIRVR